MSDFYDSIELYGQPLYSLKQQSIVGLEVLIRWKGMEEYGAGYALKQIDSLSDERDKDRHYKELDRTIITKLLAFLDECKQKPKFNVNISKYTLADSGAVNYIINLIHKHKCEDCITLELNEGSKVYKPKHIYNIEKIHKAGLRISLDDFNTMNSGISVLSRLNIDEIKFKQLGFGEFTDRDLVLLKAIKEAADGLGLVLIVEGIETTNQLQAVDKLGIDIIQGYKVGRPVSLLKLIAA